MALLSINSNDTHGFSASVGVDRILFSSNEPYVTEAKTVDGMPDVKWSIKVYPEVPSSKAYFGIYVCIESEKEINYKMSGRFMLSGYMLDSTPYRFIDVYGTHIGTTVERCLRHESIAACFSPQNIYFTNGMLKFQVDAFFSYTEKPKKIPKICCPSEWGLRLQENSDEDFEIVVGGETFRVHKLFIAAESPVFKRMFEDDFKEAKESKVTITDTDVQTVKAFIDYCYGQEMVIKDNAAEITLLYFCDKYDCQTLKPQLEAQLASKISKENISLYVSTSDKANALQLRQACVKFVRNVLNNKENFTVEEILLFDVEFMKDVFAFSGGN